MRLASLLFVTLLSCSGPWLSGQPLPDAASLIGQLGSQFEKSSSYEYTLEMVWDGPGAEALAGALSSFSVQGVPGKYRLEGKSGPIEGMLVVADGQSIWAYMPQIKAYFKSADSPAIRAAWDPVGRGARSDLAANAKVLRAETIRVDGEPYDCWVMEGRAANLPGSGGLALQDAVFTSWIDKRTGIEIQTLLALNAQAGSKAPAVVKAIKRLLKLNGYLPDSLFVFTPPPGAKETSYQQAAWGISGAAGAGLTAPNPAPPAAERRETPAAEPAPSSSAEPQAFVPGLNPLELVEPHYPEQARARGVQGQVLMLATIDPQGRVAKAEALSGPEALREPALEALRRRRFRPVLREGLPVWALTDQVEYFVLPNKRATAEDSERSSREFMAANLRVFQLAKKWPRTPQQELADLEQDRGSEHGPGRSNALLYLAKAAMEAGAMEKAEAYASEMLDLNSKDGQEVHDGNIVMGVAALRRGNVSAAKQYLLKAGKTSGSPALGSFGPNMRLAKELLEKGEREAVLEYFALCKVFWQLDRGQLEAWSAAVRDGRP